MSFSIELKKVSFGYDESKVIVKDATLAAKPAGVLAIIAPVGDGKSTLLKIFAGLIRPDDGEVIIDGRSFWELSQTEQNDIRRRMGFDFQEGALIANMTIFDNLAFPLRYHGDMSEKEITDKVDTWLKTLDLFCYRGSLPASLSMGLRRRVSFIRSTLLGVDFFFLDEPTEGADLKFTTMIIDDIKLKKSSGAGLVITTKNKELLSKAADQVIILEKGKIRYLGPLKDHLMPVDISVEAMLRE